MSFPLFRYYPCSLSTSLIRQHIDLFAHQPPHQRPHEIYVPAGVNGQLAPLAGRVEQIARFEHSLGLAGYPVRRIDQPYAVTRYPSEGRLEEGIVRRAEYDCVRASLQHRRDGGPHRTQRVVRE